MRISFVSDGYFEPATLKFSAEERRFEKAVQSSRWSLFVTSYSGPAGSGCYLDIFERPGSKSEPEGRVISALIDIFKNCFPGLANLEEVFPWLCDEQFAELVRFVLRRNFPGDFRFRFANEGRFGEYTAVLLNNKRARTGWSKGAAWDLKKRADLTPERKWEIECLRREIRKAPSGKIICIAETRRHFEQQLVQKEADFAKREDALRQTQELVAKARESINDEIANRLKKERASIAESEAKKARLALTNDLEQRDKQLAELQEILATNNAKLAEAQKAQAEVLRKERELNDARRELDLAVEKKVQESLVSVREKAKLEAEEILKSKVSEKEIQIAGMQRQIEELRRRAEQGSQQLQGEALELNLESLLRERFPRDLIEPVPKGEFGGDLLHRVLGPSERPCGTILWESKQTKNWSDGWLAKLRADQRSAGAEIALIVSSAMPKGVNTFDLIDGVWVAEVRFAIPLAIALRQSLIELAASRQAQEGQQTKMELVYRYLTGPRFRHRMEAIVEKFTDMRDDLDRERKTMMRMWAKREEQLRSVLDSTAGLYGDLQGIAGRAMAEVEGLDVLMIENTGSN